MQSRNQSCGLVRPVMNVAAVLAVSLSSASCNFVNEDELAYRQVSVNAERLDLPTAAPGSFQPLCLTAPLLMGSVIEQHRSSGGTLSMHIVATPDAVEISFSGTMADASYMQRIDISQGLPYSTEFQVESRDGAVFSVKLNSPCS